ncbi:AAA family ATPase [Yinghuangia sp. ASG 101]|uniref:helix-turn-helix transcriptional regulator n=1 Tax=Yinghuangia sp. ASG 101 TaxID=2896848 RepID=UPI001E62B86F|nr:LuxR family transcriptional regulator [Yinghuangia sp. ASG 101]UGQ12679.1 AAA family ATPase [Yinghuangia sp. ASG 101]
MFLAGRNDELARLVAAGGHSAGGGVRAVTVSGPVATGKTALLHAFCDVVADTCDGTLLLRATCHPTERDFAFGVVRQLLHDAALDGPEADVVARLLEDASYTAAFAEAGAPGGLMARAVQDLCAVFAGLARRRAVVVCVDDVRHCDPVSLDVLVRLIRRTRSARVLVVLTEREYGVRTPSYSDFAAELDREPEHVRIRLGVLSRAAVSVVLAERLGAATAARLAAETHALSGGNPLLVNALLDDLGATRADRFRRTATLAAGDAYGRALVGCLHRLDPIALSAAQGLAILGESGSGAADLAELTGLEPSGAAAAVRALHDAGLVEAGHFRDPRARTAVLDTMPRGEREAGHARAATLLHGDGGSASAVARHLMAAGEFRAPWAVPTLRAAAEDAFGEGTVGQAVACLKLAERLAADERERASVKALFVGLEWLVNPTAAARHVPWLGQAVRDGSLTGPDALGCARYLAWFGRPDEAQAAIEASLLPGDPNASVGEAPAEVRAARARLRFWYPDPEPRIAHARSLPALPATLGRVEGLDLLTSVMAGGPAGEDRCREVESRVESILRTVRLDDTTVESLTSALTALVYADRAADARAWCTTLLERAASRHSPVAHALFAGLLAEICVRQGDLPDAEEYGRLALTRIHPAGWGVAVGVPLAARITSAVARGDLDAAARHLELPVPGAMFRTPAGLHYLHACGRYNLATGRLDAALHDFTTCGRLMTAWGADLPGIVPWRVHAARAHIALGGHEAARELLVQQMAFALPDTSRTRGLALAAWAELHDLPQRPALLWQAIDELRDAGDRLELAGVYASLSGTYRDLGDFGRARRAAARAAHLTATCQARPPDTALPLPGRLAAVPDPGATDPRDAERTAGESAHERPREWTDGVPEVPGTDAPEESPVGRRTPHTAPGSAPPRRAAEPPTADDATGVALSGAERRVAALAAQGHTNREISRRLFITVSTVEQHLTRVYRKLGVARRLDLPSWLETHIAG